MKNNVPFNRPFIGFIVEGAGEYNAYPTLISKIVGNNKIYSPIINSNGYGGILNHLEENLNDLIKTYHPHSVIITIDLLDVINGNIFSNCKELKAFLVKKINSWIKHNQKKLVLSPFPESISVVIQVQRFETWFIADKFTLQRHNYIKLCSKEKPWSNVDEEIKNPCEWLNSVNNDINLKQPRQCKEVISKLDINEMKLRSYSFNKFFRDVNKIYTSWLSFNS